MAHLPTICGCCVKTDTLGPQVALGGEVQKETALNTGPETQTGPLGRNWRQRKGQAERDEGTCPARNKNLQNPPGSHHFPCHDDAQLQTLKTLCTDTGGDARGEAGCHSLTPPSGRENSAARCSASQAQRLNHRTQVPGLALAPNSSFLLM